MGDRSVRVTHPRPAASMWVRVASFVVAAVGLTVGVTACGDPGTPGASGDVVQANATVTRVVDGDTLVVDIDGEEERVRLIGINTPESVDQNRPVMCFGKEASAHIEQLVPPGTPVRIERDVEARDRYDRLLGYVYRSEDGRFVNLAMIEDGFADQYTFPPNVEHVEQFRSAASAARSSGVGLWSACDDPFEA